MKNPWLWVEFLIDIIDFYDDILNMYCNGASVIDV